MTKKNYLFIILGIVLAILIIPGVFIWLGYPTPSQIVSNVFTSVLGEASFLNNLIAFGVVGAIIALFIAGTSKINKLKGESS